MAKVKAKIVKNKEKKLKKLKKIAKKANVKAKLVHLKVVAA